jgi:hypothetical protein
VILTTPKTEHVKTDTNFKKGLQLDNIRICFQGDIRQGIEYWMFKNESNNCKFVIGLKVPNSIGALSTEIPLKIKTNASEYMLELLDFRDNQAIMKITNLCKNIIGFRRFTSEACPDVGL